MLVPATPWAKWPGMPAEDVSSQTTDPSVVVTPGVVGHPGAHVPELPASTHFSKLPSESVTWSPAAYDCDAAHLDAKSVIGLVRRYMDSTEVLERGSVAFDQRAKG